MLSDETARFRRAAPMSGVPVNASSLAAQMPTVPSERRTAPSPIDTLPVPTAAGAVSITRPLDAVTIDTFDDS